MTSERSLPTTGQLRWQIVRVESVVSVPALTIMAFYLATLLDLSASEWRSAALGVLLYAVLSTLALEPFRRRSQAPVMHYLSAQGGPALEHAQLRDAFRCIMRLPRTMMALAFAGWMSAAIFFPFYMTSVGHESWLFGDRLFGIVVAAFSGGLISMGFVYFGAKRAFEGIRLAITSDLPDPEERRPLVATVTLGRKLQLVVAGSSAASLVFTMGLAYDGAGRTLLGITGEQQQRVLEAVAPRLAKQSLDEVRKGLWPEESLAPRHLVLSLQSPGTLPEDFRPVAQALERGESEGQGASVDRSRLLAWRALPDGRVVVAASPIAALRAPLGGLRVMLGAVLAIAILVCLSISWLLAEDVKRTLAALRADVDRMASGDLRPGLVTESEDELGDLARAFQRMAGALRVTVGRVAEAADRVDSTAAEIASVSNDVAAVGADQAQRIEQANELMEGIRSQVGGVAISAQALNESIEESSSSVLEVGAAGDELSDTASVLSDKVEEVARSIEEMVRSVKRVAVISESLMEAAADTSSSMEEMASAMLAIDTTAEKTAELSRDVVASAETGQAKVRETIEGMHAIREATDAAERVIRTLGSRTEKIGAILDVIDEVGDETTLLALNAAIIAAQAGEHGRAFSVVADEIKELADRVLSSTKEIGSVVRAVQEEAANAVGAVEAGTQSVASGVDLSAAAGISLEQITRSARESGQHIARIVEAVREQTRAATHVSGLMDRVNSGVGSIREAGADQDRGNEVVYRSSLTMRDISQQVRRTTEEQSSGFARIRESVESVREAVEQINTSLQEQARACNQIAGFLETVEERTQSNERSVQSMGAATNGLVQQAEALREEVARFRI